MPQLIGNIVYIKDPRKLRRPEESELGVFLYSVDKRGSSLTPAKQPRNWDHR